MFTKEGTIFIVFIIYMAFMVGIGLIFYRKNKSIQDYILGGRRLGIWVAALSAQASDMSGWILTGLPGLAYLSLSGSKEAIWTAIGLGIGTFLNWVFVARRLRCYTEVAGNAITLPDYMENRFRDNSKILRAISAVAILVFFLFYTSSMFVAGAKLFSTVFGMGYVPALLIGAVVIVSYTFLGGFMAVSVTDFFQGMLMFFAVLIVPIIAMFSMGGPGSAMKMIDPATWQLIPDGQTLTWPILLSGLAWGLGYFGQPHILARFMALKKPSRAGPATVIAMVWVSVSLCAAVLIGLVGRIYLIPALASGNHETVFMVMVGKVFTPVVAGILLSAILAAIMSTADSQLLVTSSAITSDLYKAFFRKDAKDKELLLIGRLVVLFVSIIAVVLAFDPNSSIFGIVSYAWGGLGASFGPIILFSLFWKRMTKKGAMAGIIGGGLSVVIFKQLSKVGGIFSVYELLPAFVIASILIIVVSLLDTPPSIELCEEFDLAKEKARE
jgi:sodium/proline symporter